MHTKNNYPTHGAQKSHARVAAKKRQTHPTRKFLRSRFVASKQFLNVEIGLELFYSVVLLIPTVSNK
jgi:hypothetical protein